MGFPKPTEKNIQMTGEDMRHTDEMTLLTQEIDKRIKNKEDEISKFYAFFESFVNWFKDNKEKIKNPDQFKDLILERMQSFKDHLKNTIDFLGNIKLLIDGEQKAVSKKIMIKLDVYNDFNQQELFAKELKYPHEVIHLAKDIADRLSKGRDQSAEVLKLQKDAEKLVEMMSEMLQKISSKIYSFQTFVITSQNIADIEAKLDELFNDIKSEKESFKKLTEYEKVHLNLLLSIKEDEKMALEEERRFAEEERKLGGGPGTL